MNRSTLATTALLACLLPVFLAPPPAQSEESAEPRLIIDSHGPSGLIRDVIFTPDGTSLVSLGDDKTIRFWDSHTGDLQKTLRLEIGDQHDGKLFGGAISPDGRWLAVGGFPSRWGIRLIDLQSGGISAVLRGHTNVINDVAYSPDGRWLVSGSKDTTIRVWDMAPLANATSGTTLEIDESIVLEGHTADIYSVSFSADGNRIVAASYDNNVSLWSRPSSSGDFTKVADMDRHGKEVRMAGFSPDGRFIVSGGKDERLFLWDGRTGNFLRELDSDLGYSVTGLAFSPDNRRVLAASQSSVEGYVGVYDMEAGTKLLEFKEHTNTVLACAWHPTEDLVATAGGSDSDTYLWKPQSGEILNHIVGDGRSSWSAAFGEGGLKVAYGQTSKGNGLLGNHLEYTFDFSNFAMEELAESTPDLDGFRRVIRELGGNTLKKIDSNNLDTGSGKIEYDPTIYDHIYSYSFTPNGNVIVGSAFSLKLYQPDGKLIREFIGHEGIVWAVSPSPDGRYLATASKDQTFRLWNLQTGELLASLFVSRDGEWVCWAPSGHYHASAGGEKYMGWHINNGTNQVSDYYPSYVFREQYHHPQLVKRSVLLGDFERALAEVGDTKAPDLADVLPPRIDWILPAVTRGQSTGSAVTVKANISSPNAGLEEVKLLVNGKAVETNFRVSGNSLAYEQTIDLLPGVNRLSLFAKNTRAGHTSDERVVNVTSRQPVPLANSNRPIDSSELDNLLKPNLYIMAVGVSDYQQDSIPALDFCDDDAKAIASFFEDQEDGIFGKTEVRLLTDSGATMREIQKGLNWLESNATQKDVVVLFLAAHGINDERGNFYVLPHDADMDLLRATGVAWDDFGEVLGNLPSRVLMFLDTCHSGQLGAQLFTMANVEGTRSRSVAGLRSSFDPTEAIRELTSDENGVIIMAASTGDEESIENDNWGHGAFTMGLLEGFRGKADVNKDGIVHLRELDFFVADHVKMLTGGRQHPTTVKPSTISRLPVARVK